MAAVLSIALLVCAAPLAQPRLIQAGQTVQGSLASGDAVLDTDGSYYDLFLYSGAPGETVEIVLRSADFDAYLVGGSTESEAFALQDTDDDGAGGTDAQLSVTLGPAGTYFFLANSYESDQSGAYSVSVRSLGGGTPVAGPRGAQPIRAGQVVQGRLEEADDALPDGSYFDLYTYQGAPGETLTITLASGDFDAYLSGGRIENGTLVPEHSDDDGAGGTDARMTVTLGFSGTYGIRANSLSAGQTGGYVLSVESEGGGGMAGADVIRAGQTLAGDLTDDDPTLSDASHYDLYEFSGESFEEIEITLASGDFDAFLAGGPTPDEAVRGVDFDDDGAGGTDAQAPRAGRRQRPLLHPRQLPPRRRHRRLHALGAERQRLLEHDGGDLRPSPSARPSRGN